MNPMLLLTIARYAAVFAAGFALAWQWQGHTVDKVKLEAANKILKIEGDAKDERISRQIAARAAIERSVNQTAAAQAKAADRAIALRHSSDVAADALNSLRESSASAVRAATADAATCIDRATALAGLLDQCGREYQELGAKADRHVSDIKTLMESWPK